MARHAWEAEVEVDEALARELVRAQFPGVAAATVELVAAGWDYTIHRVDETWAFRFPRREVVIESMLRELRALPTLASVLPVPAPLHIGEPSARFAWPFYGSPFLPGHEATGASPRTGLARALGRALRTLHAAEVRERLNWLPFDVQRRADMPFRVPRVREELAALGRAPPGDLLAAAEALPPPEALAVCHGDLHFRQVLVQGDEVTGIVDWVDICVSDPGIDLQLAYSFLEGADRAAFFEEYGPAPEASHLRARVLALFLSAILARYGLAQGNGPVEREAIAALDRAVS